MLKKHREKDEDCVSFVESNIPFDWGLRYTGETKPCLSNHLADKQKRSVKNEDQYSEVSYHL